MYRKYIGIAMSDDSMFGKDRNFTKEDVYY